MITDQVHFYGCARRGMVQAEQLIVRGPDGKLTWAWTGVTYRTIAEAQAAIGAKNVAITKERYG